MKIYIGIYGVQVERTVITGKLIILNIDKLKIKINHPTQNQKKNKKVYATKNQKK